MRPPAPNSRAALTAAAGASLCATEDGRVAYLFGGHDGSGPCNDCWSLQLEGLQWSRLQPSGDALPEAREGHTAALLGNRYLLVTGGAGPAAAGGSGAAPRRLVSSWLMDVTAPAWELLSDGAACQAPWLKPVRGAVRGARRQGCDPPPSGL